MSKRSPEVEARRALAIMMVLTVVVVVFVLAADFLSTTARSVVLVAWMAVMMAVLRQTQ